MRYPLFFLKKETIDSIGKKKLCLGLIQGHSFSLIITNNNL